MRTSVQMCKKHTRNNNNQICTINGFSNSLALSDRNVHYHGCFHTPKNISAAILLHAGQQNMTSQLCVETCTDQVGAHIPLNLLTSAF